VPALLVLGAPALVPPGEGGGLPPVGGEDDGDEAWDDEALELDSCWLWLWLSLLLWLLLGLEGEGMEGGVGIDGRVVGVLALGQPWSSRAAAHKPPIESALFQLAMFVVISRFIVLP
jgi:hypothetical protein